jgi:hypothetical protein
MTFKLKGKEVTRCDDCPSNQGFPNPLWNRLPPIHKCIDYGLGGKDGKSITTSRFKIPDWCPHNDRIVINGRSISACKFCPFVEQHENLFVKAFPVFSCGAIKDENNPIGKVIAFPDKTPKWCPHVKPD